MGVQFFPEVTKIIQKTRQRYSENLDDSSEDVRAGIKNGEELKIEFPRTSEVLLFTGDEKQVHYRKSLDGAEENKIRGFPKTTLFVEKLNEISPQLKTAIYEMFYQAGPFFTGRIALEQSIFPSAAVQPQGLTHKIRIDVGDSGEVIVTEKVTYNQLRLNLPHAAAMIHSIVGNETKSSLLSEQQYAYLSIAKDVLKNYWVQEREVPVLFPEDPPERNYFSGGGGEFEVQHSTIGDDLFENLVFLNEPLSLTVRYTLRRNEEGDYQLLELSEDDISINFPTPVKELFFKDFSTPASASNRRLLLVELIIKIIEWVQKILGIGDTATADVKKSAHDPATANANERTSFIPAPRM